MAYQDFTDGNTLLAPQLDELSKQGVLKYASAAARDADALLNAALREGMVCYLDDTNALAFYDGSTWVAFHSARSLTSPILNQSSTVTYTATRSKYAKAGRE